MLKKNSVFANLKKYYYYKYKICVLKYIVSAQKIRIEEEKIEVLKTGLNQK